ncbi:hypothetical protein L6Q96_10930 [Candidatus Binatia bacterium]|nr:hypothetical protein [Candidatus Binatia bacterium]
MNRWGRTLTFVVGCAAVLAACRQFVPLPQNSFLRLRQEPRPSMSTADARQYFAHDGHARAFRTAGIQCIDCHRFDFTIDTADPKIYEPLSAHALYPGSATCHPCHTEGPGKMAAAPPACTNCHTNMAPLEPEDHQIAWLKVHGTQARANPVHCESCHRQSYCIDCHERRDTIQTVAHERNFFFVHGIQARTDPMQCSACHREDYCINCHLLGRKAPS